jgi:hypothetical protein
VLKSAGRPSLLTKTRAVTVLPVSTSDVERPVIDRSEANVVVEQHRRCEQAGVVQVGDELAEVELPSRPVDDLENVEELPDMRPRLATYVWLPNIGSMPSKSIRMSKIRATARLVLYCHTIACIQRFPLVDLLWGTPPVLAGELLTQPGEGSQIASPIGSRCGLMATSSSPDLTPAR